MYKEIIEKNNETINELKEQLTKYYNKETEIKTYTFKDDINTNELKEIIEKQEKDINNLHILINIEANKYKNKINSQIEKLKKEEKDKDFSEFYRHGKININNIDINVDDIYIRELISDNNTMYDCICTDERVDKNIFNTTIINNYKVNNIYNIKDSTIFYEIYKDKRLFINKKIVLNTKEKKDLFINYLKKWKKERHYLVAETMIYKFIK